MFNNEGKVNNQANTNRDQFESVKTTSIVENIAGRGAVTLTAILQMLVLPYNPGCIMCVCVANGTNV